MRLIHLALITLFAGTIAILASCDSYGSKEPETPPQTYGQNCPKVAPTPVPVSQPPNAAEEAACTAAGGTLQQVGLAGGFNCILPYCDAGEACSDSSECIGKCFASGAGGPIGSPATGACQPDSNPFGCRAEVVGGQLGATLCVD